MKDDKDYNGVKMGHWMITGPRKKIGKYYFWNAKCACGKESQLRTDVIRWQRSNSCLSCKQRGKPSRTRLSDRVQAIINTEYSIYKSGAKLAKREFTITKEEFTKFINSRCHYCLDTPNRLVNDISSDTAILIHGVDRINSNVGYTTQNCVSCCSMCNYMKNDSSIQTFKSHVLKVHANLANF